MKKIYMVSGITAISALILTVVAFAALGDHVASVNFSVQCTSGIGVGIAFDGENLWYSCHEGTLHRANPITGQVTASYTIASGLDALSYDVTRNAIWAAVPNNRIWRIDLNSSKDVIASAQIFTVADSCGIIDGLAFDARNIADPNDDVFYYSDDCWTLIVDVYNMGGGLVESFPVPAGFGAHNSGLAVGGQLLYIVDMFNNRAFVVDKTTKDVQFNFTTAVAGDPNFHPEDEECDTNTFAAQGKHVMWSKEAYSPMRAHAFEIPFGSCGVGGVPSGICPETETDTMTLQTNRWMFDGTDWITNLPEGVGPQKSYTIEDTQGCGCEQILDWLHENYPDIYGEMEGQHKFGCSISIMDEFIELTSGP